MPGDPVPHPRQRSDARQRQNFADFAERRNEAHAAELKPDALPLRSRIAFVRQLHGVAQRIRLDVTQDLQYLARCHSQ